MHVVQKSSMPVPTTEVVWYSGSDTLVAGYVLCMDLSEGLAPSAGEFDELQLGTVYAKPATANLHGPKRIVKTAPVNTPGWVETIDPRNTTRYNALVDGTADVAAGDILIAVDDEYHLIVSAAAVTAQDPRLIVGMAGEAWTTNSAANKVVISGHM